MIILRPIKNCVDYLIAKARSIGRDGRASAFLRTMLLGSNPNDVILLVGPGIGDTVYAMAYVSEYKAHNPEKNIVIVGREDLRELISSYTGYDELRLLEKTSMAYSGFLDLIRSRKATQTALKKNVINMDPWHHRSCYKASNPAALHQIRTALLGLPDDVRIQRHGLADHQSNRLNHGFPEKMAILNCDSNSMEKVDPLFFEYVANDLSERGYRVYTNVSIGDPPVKGTKRLECTIKELCRIVGSGTVVVSVRSGILDLLISQRANIFAIYSGCSSQTEEMYALGEWMGAGILGEAHYDRFARGSLEKLVDEYRGWVSKLDSDTAHASIMK